MIIFYLNNNIKCSTIKFKVYLAQSRVGLFFRQTHQKTQTALTSSCKFCTKLNILVSLLTLIKHLPNIERGSWKKLVLKYQTFEICVDLCSNSFINRKCMSFLKTIIIKKKLCYWYHAININSSDPTILKCGIKTKFLSCVLLLSLI